MQEVLETNDITINTTLNSTQNLCNDTGKRLGRHDVGVGVVYRAICVVNNKIYIGVTSQRLEERISSHLKLSKRENPKYLFARAIKKYGRKSFIFDVIDTYNTIKERNEKEIKHIKEYSSFYLNGHGYNMTLGGDGSEGHIKSSEAIRKMKDARAKQRFSQETRDLWSKNRIGKTRTIEQRQYMSQRMIETECHKKTEVHKQKIREARLGSKATEETKKRQSIGMLGKNKKYVSPKNLDLIRELYKTHGLNRLTKDLHSRGIFIGRKVIFARLVEMGIYNKNSQYRKNQYI